MVETWQLQGDLSFERGAFRGLDDIGFKPREGLNVNVNARRFSDDKF